MKKTKGRKVRQGRWVAYLRQVRILLCRLLAIIMGGSFLWVMSFRTESFHPLPLNMWGRGEVRCEEVNTDDVSPEFQQLLIAYLDPHFYLHKGVDVNIEGPTLTQRVVEQLFGCKGGWWTSYFTFLADLCWSKEHTLRLFLNFVPINEHTYGVESAAHVLFGCRAAQLTFNQSATLVALIADGKEHTEVHMNADLRKRRHEVERCAFP